MMPLSRTMNYIIFMFDRVYRVPVRRTHITSTEQWTHANRNEWRILPPLMPDGFSIDSIDKRRLSPNGHWDMATIGIRIHIDHCMRCRAESNGMSDGGRWSFSDCKLISEFEDATDAHCIWAMLLRGEILRVPAKKTRKMPHSTHSLLSPRHRYTRVWPTTTDWWCLRNCMSRWQIGDSEKISLYSLHALMWTVRRTTDKKKLQLRELCLVWLLLAAVNLTVHTIRTLPTHLHAGSGPCQHGLLTMTNNSDIKRNCSSIRSFVMPTEVLRAWNCNKFGCSLEVWLGAIVQRIALSHFRRVSSPPPADFSL